MAHPPCPLLGTLDDNNNPGPPVGYPSFENKCMVADDRDMLLLADQATYCLAGGCRLCPRYRAAQAMATHGRVDANTAAEVAGGVLASDQLRPELMALAGADEGVQARRRWAWLSTAVLFIAMMLCGASFAAWSGWQQVQSFLDERQAGSVESVASGDVALAPQFVVLTAIAPQVANAASAPLAQSDAQSDAQVDVQTGAQAGNGVAPVQAADSLQPQVYPPAVTPTPQSGVVDVPLIVVEPQPSMTPPNILLEVPTRRATPVFDIPTSTAAAETATNTPTQTPSATPMGTPVIVFAPAQQLVPDGGCTILSWDVRNVREVYYENQGVDGRGQKEECVNDLVEIYHLVVVLEDGSARTYTTTVTMLMPTDTPRPTPTFTEIPVFTPTWTPLPPTATPTPDINWGVAVSVQGGTDQICARGATCKIELVVTNTGEVIDSMLVGMVDRGPWPAELCRGDGVCANNNLALPSMGPGNEARITLGISIPGDAATDSVRYGIQAVSSGSGGTVSSGATVITIVPQ